MESEERREHQRMYRKKNRAKINLRNKKHRLFMKMYAKEDIIEFLVKQYLEKVEGTRD